MVGARKPDDIRHQVAAEMALSRAERAARDRGRDDLAERAVNAQRTLRTPPTNIVDILRDFAEALEVTDAALLPVAGTTDDGSTDAIDDLRAAADKIEQDRQN